MRDTVRLGKLRGVPVGLNWSLLVVVVLFALGLADNRFPADAPGHATALYVLAGVLCAVGLLVAVLLHELAHAIAARRAGLPVDGITLSWMGGVTRMQGDSTTPRSELVIAGVGPLTSLVIGGLLWVVREVGVQAHGGPLLASALGWLAIVNVALALFNMLPAAPLDGGRVFHAIVWKVTGDRWRATRWASQLGVVLGSVMVGIGFFELVNRGNQLDGLFLAGIGWWLASAARSEQQVGALQGALAGIKVGDIMRPVASAPGWITVDAFLETYGSARPNSAWLLESWGGGYSGVLTMEMLRPAQVVVGTGSSVQAGGAQRGRRVADLAVPVAQAAPATASESALAALTRSGGKMLVVVEGDRSVGVVVPADVVARVRRGSRPSPSGSAAAGVGV